MFSSLLLGSRLLETSVSDVARGFSGLGPSLGFEFRESCLPSIRGGFGVHRFGGIRYPKQGCNQLELSLP